MWYSLQWIRFHNPVWCLPDTFHCNSTFVRKYYLHKIMAFLWHFLRCMQHVFITITPLHSFSLCSYYEWLLSLRSQNGCCNSRCQKMEMNEWTNNEWMIYLFISHSFLFCFLQKGSFPRCSVLPCGCVGPMCQLKPRIAIWIFDFQASAQNDHKGDKCWGVALCYRLFWFSSATINRHQSAILAVQPSKAVSTT